MNIELTDEAISTNTSPTILRDTILTGFGVRIYQSGKVSYFIEPTINGKSKRKVIAKYPNLSVPEARVLGEAKMQELTSTPSPVPTSSYSATSPLFSTAYDSYVSNITLKPSTVESYKGVYDCYLQDFHHLPINNITEDLVVSVYLKNCERSIAQSNKSMKILQAVLRYSGMRDNPIQILATKRLTKQLKPRTSYIPLQDLPLFYKGLLKLKNEHTHLYLELLLHTGLRANEAMQITSSSVATGVLIITETKNHSDHSIPLTRWLTDNLIPFLDANPEGFKSSDIRKSLLTASQYLGYRITRHDLRRTFASYASEAGCDYLLIKRALNHSVSDITARYIQTSPKTLSPVFEAVAELIAEHNHL